MCQDNHDNHKKKRALDLKNKAAHKEDHKQWSRRNFLQTLGIAGGASLALGGFSLNAMALNQALPQALAAGEEDRVLVLIRLKGGNDGLNMVVPLFDYGTYQNFRPGISIPEDEVLNLNNAFGLPNTMESLMPMWNDGKMKIINTVGYDDQNLSHFRSADIWSSASEPDVIDSSGWMGRYIMNQVPDVVENPPEVPMAIKIGGAGSLTFNNQDLIDLSVNFLLPEELAIFAETGELYDTANLPDNCYYGDQVGFLRSITNSTLTYAEVMSQSYTNSSNSIEYSNNILSRQLAVIARLIKGNLGTKLYFVTLDGFDTHAGQPGQHSTLMNYLATAVSEFYTDLGNSGHDQDVLSMTFSEFGRRVQQNASQGTDHGTAAPTMFFGPGLNGSDILGDQPDLQNLDDDGNLFHSVDFRSIYATVLESWLCLDPTSVDLVMGETFDRIDDLGLECSAVSTHAPPLVQGIRHEVRQDGFGGNTIVFDLDRPGQIELSIFTMLGQKVVTLVNGYKMAGRHEVVFPSRQFSITRQTAVYRIFDGKRQYSGKFIVNN